MSKSKHFDKIAYAVTALMLVITLLFMNGASLGISVAARTFGYETRLFDKSRVHTIDIVMDDWDSFIATCENEEYALCAVVIDGEAYKNVGIRAKGNTSLSSVSQMDSDRYSFKVEFDQYDSTKSYYGLDKLSLNNLIQDNTMMKDYLVYTMMGEFGAASPLCSFAYITVNGEDWGLYLAVEGIEDAFLERNYGTNHGELYKPDSTSMGGGRGNGKNFNMDDFSESFESDSVKIQSEETTAQKGGFGGRQNGMQNGSMPEMPQNEASNEQSSERKSAGNRGGMNMGDMGGAGGMGGMGSSDVKLQYIDGEIDSYQNIWNNAKTDITEADQLRLIESLKKLSANEDIESVVSVEDVIRYFVVHNYVCNGDSYTGSMIHNYYLYEENGQLSMLPWDYNLAFGTFQSSNTTSTVNTPIDSPVSGGSSADRPMLNWIFESEEYTEMYHEYFAEFLSTVDITGIIDAAYELIAPYVEKDPTKFCTYDEFEVGVKTLREFCTLRSESIGMQLESGETATDMGYVDASHITISDMGSMSMGGGHGENKGGRTESNGTVKVQAFRDAAANEFFGGMPTENAREMPSDDGDMMRGGMGGEMQRPSGSAGEQQPTIGDTSERPVPAVTEDSANDTAIHESTEENAVVPTAPEAPNNSEMPTQGGQPFGDMGQNFQGRGENVSIDTSSTHISSKTAISNEWILLGISMLVLWVGIVVAVKYKR